ncbi:hypothetical protein AKL17_2172 [Frigidibacter mobilis]|uniref:Uncharacterized protein n=1 Tax=Frigidibacter mobilis TaxID=1335048 RepID=A0A159Z4Y7_9RHOB|nr:hypothetical protein AKL17_2172 [Frigidibacter mobilis]
MALDPAAPGCLPLRRSPPPLAGARAQLAGPSIPGTPRGAGGGRSCDQRTASHPCPPAAGLTTSRDPWPEGTGVSLPAATNEGTRRSGPGLTRPGPRRRGAGRLRPMPAARGHAHGGAHRTGERARAPRPRRTSPSPARGRPDMRLTLQPLIRRHGLHRVGSGGPSAAPGGCARILHSNGARPPCRGPGRGSPPRHGFFPVGRGASLSVASDSCARRIGANETPTPCRGPGRRSPQRHGLCPVGKAPASVSRPADRPRQDPAAARGARDGEPAPAGRPCPVGKEVLRYALPGGLALACCTHASPSPARGRPDMRLTLQPLIRRHGLCPVERGGPSAAPGGCARILHSNGAGPPCRVPGRGSPPRRGFFPVRRGASLGIAPGGSVPTRPRRCAGSPGWGACPGRAPGAHARLGRRCCAARSPAGWPSPAVPTPLPALHAGGLTCCGPSSPSSAATAFARWGGAPASASHPTPAPGGSALTRPQRRAGGPGGGALPHRPRAAGSFRWGGAPASASRPADRPRQDPAAARAGRDGEPAPAGRRAPMPGWEGTRRAGPRRQCRHAVPSPAAHAVRGAGGPWAGPVFRRPGLRRRRRGLPQRGLAPHAGRAQAFPASRQSGTQEA